MGGHAFKRLSCPRILPEVYFKTREHTIEILRSLFKNVAVPTEMPEKADYGDVDFLVSGFLLESSGAALRWENMVSTIQTAFNTPHGKHGFLNRDVMYFAIPHPDTSHSWIQIDVKVCDSDDEITFAWTRFQLQHASGSKMLGSLIKPLGLTISPTGLHIRVEEMEATDYPGSMVFVSKQPVDVLSILGLHRRFLHGVFATQQEIYEYFASSWVFHPAHFAARLEEEKYRDHLEDRSTPWVTFVTEWVPQRYPGYRLLDQDVALEDWRKRMRAAMREKVFTLFPHITPEYYAKRGVHLKEVEENRVRQLLTEAIPTAQDGWSDDNPQPIVRIQNPTPATPPLKPTTPGQGGTARTPDPHNPMMDIHNGLSFSLPPTPPHTPPPSTGSVEYATEATGDPLSTPLYLQPLPRDPPLAFVCHPPADNMSPTAKLDCLARWTLFDPLTGALYLARSPRDKTFAMCWSDSGASDEVLVKWAKEMWWGIWVRQARVNYVGMWKRRFEKEDAKVVKEREKARKEAEEREEVKKVEAEAEAKRAKILERLAGINMC